MEKKWQVLVIDDFAPMRNTIRTGLEQSHQFQVQVLAKAEQIWEVLAAQPVDLVLCDVNMPGLSGIDMLEQIRQHSDYAQMPFVLMTGDGSKALVSKAIELAVTDFVVKPFTLNQLKERVLNALTRKPRLLPVQPQTHRSPTLNSAPAEQASNKARILVVDDEPLNLELVFNLLKDDYSVSVANNGQKALQIATSDTPPDLVLLDVMMPDLDGYQVCQSLMEQCKQDIPVIFLSARTAVEDVTRGFALGAVDYVYKPLQPEILKARIRVQLAQRQAREEFRRSISLLMENARLKQDIEHICRHDLKNPLGSALMHLKLLLDDSQVTAHLKEQLQQICQSTQLAFGLLEQSADLLHIENGSYRLSPEPVEIAPLLRQVQHDLQDLIQQKHLQMTTKLFAKQPVVKGESQLCYFVFSNLLKNAIEAAPVRTEIVISVEELQDSVAIRFYNDGAVPAEIRDNLFDKYVSAGKQSGTGLGSYSARMMTLVQKGDIHFKVLNENKTVFTVSLPRLNSLAL